MKSTFVIPIAFFFSLVLYTPLFSQRYIPATVLFHSGQSETGSVYYGNWVETPQFFRFKDKSGAEKKYGPERIRSIEVTRKDGQTERFESRVVEVNRSPNKLSSLEVGPAPRMVKDTVFLQALLLSDINLYLLFQDNVQHYFAEKDSLKELVFKRYLREPNDPALLTNNRYRQQLLALTIDCAYLKDQILKSSYSEKQIRDVLLEYNRYKKTTVTYRYKPERIKIGFYLGGGLTRLSLLDVQPDGVLIVEPIRIFSRDEKFHFTPVAGFLVPIPRTNERFFIKTDVGLRNIEYAYGIETSNDTIVEEIKLLHFRSQTLVQWNFLNRRAKMYLQGGIIGSWVIGDESVLNIGSVGGTYKTVQRTRDFGLVAGAGLTFDRLGLEVRYDRSKGYTPSAVISSSLHTFTLFLTCRLF